MGHPRPIPHRLLPARWDAAVPPLAWIRGDPRGTVLALQRRCMVADPAPRVAVSLVWYPRFMAAGGFVARSIAVGSLMTLCSASLASGARADTLSALWVERGVRDADREPLRAAVAAELDVEVVESTGTLGRLRRMARRLPADSTADTVAREERAALEAYLHLQFARAEQAFERAITAALSTDRGVAEGPELSRLVFGRALVRLAAQRSDDAALDLALAAALDPGFAPDRDEYGPPIFRAIADARHRAATGPTGALRVDVSPRDATVKLDGQPVPMGQALSVAAASAHLLTVERPGYVPRSQLVTAGTTEAERIEIVLDAAEGPLLAHQALDLARAEGGDSVPDFAAPLVARALGLDRWVRAVGDAGGTIEIALGDAATGEVIRTIRAGRVTWEATPFVVLAAALAGRVIEPPAPSDVSLTVAAPSRVEPGAPIAFRVSLRDREHRVDRVAVRCGELSTRLRLDSASASGHIGLTLDAPEDQTTLACRVLALDSQGRVLGDPPGELSVIVEESERAPFYGTFWFWGAAGLAVAAGITAAVLATELGGSTEQTLRNPWPDVTHAASCSSWS